MSDEPASPFLGNARYEVARQLGVGGMGVVFEARDRERDTLVAVKTLRRVGPAAIARFKREFRALADVVHPNLVSLYELVAERDDLFIAMELVRGVAFDRWVMGASHVDDVSTDERAMSAEATRTGRRGEPQAHAREREREDDTDETFRAPSLGPERPRATLDLTRLRAGLRQLAEGVAAIHGAGMLHRDLKPSNVLVTDDGRVVVLDFGLVTDLAEETPQTSEERPLEGTFGYMSPEQGARAPLSPASDWYSVGVILYRLLTGRMPFLGGRDDVLMDKQRFEPPPPRELAPDVPEDLAALCAELLRRQPERRPTEADILRRVGSLSARARGSGGAAGRSGGTSQVAYDTLVGRERELDVIGRAYDRAKHGAPVLVRVHGPSGAGKSRLVRGFLDGLPDGDGAVVLRGRCYEQESVPFKAIDSIVDALAGHLARLPALDVEGLMPRDAVALARLFPTLRQVESFTARRRREVATPDPLELRRRGFAALRELFARVADRHPLVLSIDDLQWGDVDSVTLLAALLREPDAPAMLLVVTFRSEGRDTNPFLAAFDEQVARSGIALEDVLVGPIADADALRLALIHLGGGGDAADAARIVVEAQGNPFLVEELARHARERAVDERPVSLDDALRGRVLRLPREAGRLLAIVAVAGRPIPQPIAMRAAGVDDPAVLALLKVAAFVRTRSAGEHRFVEPYHDRVREIVVALQSPDERRYLHLRLAESYEAAPAPDPETLAVHYAAADERGRASELAMVAARRAAEALAFDRAASLYRTAVELATAPVDRRVYVALGNALASGGRGVESADAFLAALDGAAPAEALELRCRAAGQLMFSGHIDRGLATLDQVIGAVGLRPARTPARALMSIGLDRVRLAVRGLAFREIDEREVPASQLVKLDVAFAAAEGLGMTDPIRATAFQVRSLLLALKVGEPKRVVRALAAEIAFTSLRGVSASRRSGKLQVMLDELVARLGDPDSRGIAEGARAIGAFNEGRFVACGDAAARAEEIFRDECTGLRWELATAQLFHGFALALTGRVRELIARFPVLIKEATERGDLYATTTLSACLGFYVPLAHDEPALAHAEVDAAIARWSGKGFQLPHANALNAHVCVDLYAGEGHRALARIEEAWPLIEKALLLRVQTMRVILWSIRARSMLACTAADGDRTRLRRVAKIARALDGERTPYCAAEAIMLRAGIAHHTGDPARAIALLADAEEAYRQVDLVLNQLAVRHARGALVGGDDGAALIRAADTPLAEQGVRRPDRVHAVFAPGFER